MKNDKITTAERAEYEALGTLNVGIPTVGIPHMTEAQHRRWTELHERIEKEIFDSLIAEQQEIQKRNPFGSPAHRQAYERIREAVKTYKGNDIGDYE